MRMIVGLDAPTRGHGHASTAPPTATSTAPLHEVGALLEARAIHTGRSAYNHLLAMAQTHGIGARAGARRSSSSSACSSVARKRVGRFSLGMGQRLGHRLGAARRPADA